MENKPVVNRGYINPNNLVSVQANYIDLAITSIEQKEKFLDKGAVTFIDPSANDTDPDIMWGAHVLW